jgi:hypothetical protein
MKTRILSMALLAGMAVVAIGLSQCSSPAPEEKPKEAATGHDEMSQQEKIAHGEYMVNAGGCNDCHSPKIMTDHGPVVDSSRMLSGAPSTNKLAPIHSPTIAPGNWYLGSADLTTWVGPWGISFAANLTPDSATGTGTWTEEMFLKILHTGKFMAIESGRPIMPPMPWESIGKMSDHDLKCIFAYLQSLKPISNVVPSYVPPNEIVASK